MDDRHARHRHRATDPRRRPVDGFRLAGGARFDRLIGQVLADLPGPVLAHLRDVDLRLADIPPPNPEGTSVVVPLAHYDPAGRSLAGRQRARLTLFRRPIEARARSKEELLALLRELLVREVAVQLGIDDDRLEDLGWL